MSNIEYNELGDRMSYAEGMLLLEIKKISDNIDSYAKPYAESQLKKLNQKLEEFRARKRFSNKNVNNHNQDTKKVLPRKELYVKKERKKQKRVGDNYFLAKSRGVIRNDSYRKLFKGPGTVYEYLWANIVRGHMNNDKYNILENYYLKEKLAYCTSERHIAKECFMDKNTVHRIIKDFEKAGVIKVESVKNEPGKRPQNVYILGTWSGENDDRTEHYYIDSVFTAE